MLSAILLVVAAQSSARTEVQTGPWRAELASPTGPLPFGMQVSVEKDHVVVSIENGEEVIAVPDVRFENGANANELVLDFPHYDAQVRAKVEDGGKKLSGEWRKRAGPDRWAKLPFHAQAGYAPRFDVPAGNETERVLGRWKVQFEKDKEPAVAVFGAGKGKSPIDGTVLTPTGDFRYLSGAFASGKLQLSCFDGAHAFLIVGTMGSDGSLKGTFSSGDSWTDAWTAVRDEKAELPDEMGRAHWNDAFGLAQLEYPDLDGKMVSLGDARFAGKARILQIGGSWCPNCQDETELLAQMDRTYREKGLSITALCFEVTGEHENDSVQAKKMLARHGAQYLGLLCGRSDRKLAQQALPALDTVFAFPMTVFLHKDGRVRAVHAGFSGPATGPAYEKQRAEFAKLVEELLAEKVTPSTIGDAEVTGELWRDERDRTFTNSERGEDGAWHYSVMEMTRFDRPTRTDPLERGVVVVDGSTVRLGATVLFHDVRARVMLDASDVEHRFTPATRSPFPFVDSAGYSEMPLILEGLSSTDAVRRRESVFYLALQIAQDRRMPPEMGGGQLDPGLGVNLLPLVDDADPGVRATACWAAGVVGLTKTVPSLVESLGHGFAPVRREAARALGRLHAVDALEKLEKLANEDVDPLVRARATESVQSLRAK